MVWGKKDKKPSRVIELEDEEESEDENEEESNNEESDEKEIPKSNIKKKLKQESKIIKPSARIVSGEIISDGVYKFTLITNKSIGEIGEEFDI